MKIKTENIELRERDRSHNSVVKDLESQISSLKSRLQEAERRAEHLSNQLYNLPLTTSPGHKGAGFMSYRGASPTVNQSFCD